jgi:hypothetical protein
MSQFVGLPGIENKKIDNYQINLIEEESIWIIDEIVAKFGIDKEQANQILSQMFKKILKLIINGEYVEYKSLIKLGTISGKLHLGLTKELKVNIINELKK